MSSPDLDFLKSGHHNGLMLNGEQIAELRKELGLTQKEFGERVGSSESCVCLWESGKRHPTYGKMLKLNKLLTEARNGKKAKVTA